MPRSTRRRRVTPEDRHLTAEEIASIAWRFRRLAETPLLHHHTLAEALEQAYGGKRPWEDETTPPEVADCQRRDVETVADLVIRCTFMKDDDEVAPGVTRRDLLRAAEEAARRVDATSPRSVPARRRRSRVPDPCAKEDKA